MEKHGIKETSEVLVALNELTVVLAKLLKDGVQMTDLNELISLIVLNPEFRSRMQLAFENAKACTEEIKDLSIVEGLALVKIQMEYVPKVIEAFSKK